MMQNEVLSFNEFGEPRDVLELKEEFLPEELGEDEVLVEGLYAPIHPADLNFIQGVYGVRPHLPAIPGNEGVGRVMEVGSSVKGLEVGRCVVLPRKCGSWRRRVVAKAEDFFALPQGIDPQQAAMISINPVTAWRMLRDFHDFNSGGCVIQNAANSAVGECVRQLAALWEIPIIHVARRPEVLEEMKQKAPEGGQELFFEDTPLAAKEIRKICEKGDFPVPQLALNAVSGESALTLAKSLGEGGAVVTYGAMARKPLAVSNSLLIFRDIQFRGFWVSRWYESTTQDEIRAVWGQIAQWMVEGDIRVSVNRSFSLEAYEEAISCAEQEKRSGKVLFNLT